MKIKKELRGNCLNCGTQLQSDDHFCPRCGQKVDRNDLRLAAVFKEFFENYLSFDSRLGRTLIPFFFRPGYLANEFVKGVRINYANPFRLFIFTSIFFFFCLNANVKIDNSDRGYYYQADEELKAYPQIDRALSEKLNDNLPQKVIQSLNQSKEDEFRNALLELPERYQSRILPLLSDSIAEALQINSDSLEEEHADAVSFDTNSKGVFIDLGLDEIDMYLRDPNYTNEMLYDSLAQGKTYGFWQQLVLKQMIKIERASDAERGKYILSNLSLGMFVVVPLFAFFVMLLYWRRNKFYVAHLIHVIYLQSFAYLLFGIALFLKWLDVLNSDTLKNGLWICTLLFAIYFISSFRRIYKQGWFKLLFKSFLLVLIYNTLTVFVLALETVISLLFF